MTIAVGATSVSARENAAATSGASQGRNTYMPGMLRSAASCSTGWCVGPSSPTPMESWDRIYVTGNFIIALMRIAYFI